MMISNDTIDPNKSLRRNLLDSNLGTDYINCPPSGNYDDYEYIKLKDLSADNIEWGLENIVANGKHYLEIEIQRRELVHMIDGLKLSLENGVVNTNDMKVIKKHLLELFDSMYEK